MKKTILPAAILAFAGLTTVKASAVTIRPASAIVQQDTVKTPVNLANLPDPVKKTLEDATFKEWTPSTATLVKAGSTAYYLIAVKNGDQYRSVKIDPNGKVIQ